MTRQRVSLLVLSSPTHHLLSFYSCNSTYPTGCVGAIRACSGCKQTKTIFMFYQHFSTNTFRIQFYHPFLWGMMKMPLTLSWNLIWNNAWSGHYGKLNNPKAWWNCATKHNIATYSNYLREPLYQSAWIPEKLFVVTGYVSSSWTKSEITNYLQYLTKVL